MNLDGFTYGEILELFKALHFGVGNNMVPSDFKKWLDNLSECPEEKYKFTDRSNMMKFVKDISCNQVLRNFDIQLWSELISRRVTNCKYEDMQRCWVCGDNVYKYSKRRECFRHQGTEKCLACDEPATDVHHERPQKLEPFFALDPDFAWSCCEKCHYEKGHKNECSTRKIGLKVCNG